MSKLLVALIVLLIVGVSTFFILPSFNSITNDVPDSTNERVAAGENGMKTFVLTGENFKFTMNGVDNPKVEVNQGDKVRIEFTSTKGFHDWVLDEFGAATEQVKDGGGMTSVEFVADKKGTFEYYCSVGQHRANGMEGKFVVK